MKQQPSDRAIILGEYILEHKATVRAAAAWFGISKSTVHKDVSQRLSELSPSLYAGVKEILVQNKQERHIRGGMATKKKYAQLAALQKKVLLQNQHNQNLLKIHIEQIKKQIAEVHRANPYLGKRSVYAGANSAGGSFIAEA